MKMTLPSRLSIRLLALALSLPAGVSLAQGSGSTGPVLSGKAVTEDALTKALTPASGGASAGGTGADSGAADDGTRTRSLKIGPAQMKPSRRADEPSAAATPQSGGGAASLLITFETNSTAISPSSISALDKLGRALKGEQLALYKFDVEGHADPRGNADENLKLSQGRAESVVGYLVSKHGIDAARLRAVGKGDRELANPRNTAAPENRRVTVRNQSN